MRDSTFSSVLLPAPFGPTMPITSPTPTRNETSFSAQNVVSPSPLAGHLPESPPRAGDPGGDRFAERRVADRRRADRVLLAELLDDDGVR